MNAKDFRLVVAGLSGSPYIATVSKKNPGVMNSNRREVPLGEFVKAIIEWAENNYNLDETIELKRGGKVVLEMKFPPQNEVEADG